MAELHEPSEAKRGAPSHRHLGEMRYESHLQATHIFLSFLEATLKSNNKCESNLASMFWPSASKVLSLDTQSPADGLFYRVFLHSLWNPGVFDTKSRSSGAQ